MLKVGVIGAGGIANGIHLPVLSRNADVELVAVCDIVREKAEATAERFNVSKAYAVYGEMLKAEDIDAVFVLAEPDSLFRISADCLHAGRHVFMEKPMGITAFQAEGLRDIAIKTRRLLHVGYNRRAIPLVVEVVSELRKLTHGRINQVSGYFYKNSSASFYGGCASAFICDVIHVLDVIRHIATDGADIATTKMTCLETVSPATRIPEAWHCALRFDNGIDATVDANYNTGGRAHGLVIHGEGASATINLGFGDAGCDAWILQGDASFSIVSSGASKAVRHFDGKKIAGSDRYEDYYGYRDEDAAFIAAVLKDPSSTDIPRLDADLASMRLAEALLATRA